MKKTLATSVAVLLLVSAVVLSGCAEWFKDPTVDANKAINKANASYKKFTELDAQRQQIALGLDTLAPTKDGAAQGLAITAQLRELLPQETAALDAAAASLKPIQALKVRDEMKQYAKLEVKRFEALSKCVAKMAEIYAEDDRVYTAMRDGTNTPEATEASITRITTLQDELTALREAAATAGQTAADYFTKNKLGG